MTITHYSSLETLAATEFRSASWWATVARALDDLDERLAHGAAVDDGPAGALVDAVKRQPSLSNAAARLREDQARLSERVRRLRRLVAEVAGDDREAAHVAEELAALASAEERHQQRSRALSGNPSPATSAGSDDGLADLLDRTPTLRGGVGPGVGDGTPEPLRHVDGSHPQSLLRVGLIGFGRTGRDVAKLLLDDDTMSLEWVLRRSESLENRSVAEVLGVQSDESGVIHSASHIPPGELLDRFPVDVIIDFSSESAIDYYGDQAAQRRIAIVSAISRYSEARQRQLSRLAGPTRVLWSPNITIGINFLLLASQSLQRIAPGTDVQIIEEHFRDKAEVSGTALRLARALEAPDDAVHSVRAGGIVGVHEVIFGFPAQTVRLRHEAISREAFGHGAVFAARQVHPREPGLYRMEDLLLPFFARGERAVVPRRAPRGGLRGRFASQLRAAARRLE